MTGPDRTRNPLEKLLGLFTEVKPGEAGTTLLLALNVFLLLTAYYLIKPVRESLILTGSGAEVKSYASAGQVLLLAMAVPLYARLAGRFERRKLISIVTLFFMACLVAFYFLVLAGASVGVVFYLWVGIFNLMVIAQFWSFANDVYTTEEGKRLFVIIAFGASLGAVVGSKTAGLLLGLVGMAQLLLLACALLGVSIVLTNIVDTRERRRGRAVIKDPESRVVEPIDGEAMGKTSGFKLVMRSRYLTMIAFLMLLANWVNTTGEYILGKLVSNAAAEAVATGTVGVLDVGTWIGQFYSDFFFYVNLLGLVLQLFAVSRILKYMGVRVALLILPVTALAGNLLVVALPVLAYLRWTKTLENATDYSLQNTVRNVLFLPCTREEKYNAKQAIDTFFVRAGDVFSAGIVFVGTAYLGFNIRSFAAFNAGLVVIWVILAVLIGREYRARTESGE
ncbi:MAG: translocase [Candidatus Krumholzibacteria bacterium]|nr:translocase [Candidatus Krumholzibacteria bacterium]